MLTVPVVMFHSSPLECEENCAVFRRENIVLGTDFLPFWSPTTAMPSYVKDSKDHLVVISVVPGKERDAVKLAKELQMLNPAVRFVAICNSSTTVRDDVFDMTYHRSQSATPWGLPRYIRMFLERVQSQYAIEAA